MKQVIPNSWQETGTLSMIIQKRIMVQSNLFKRPPLWDDHSSKTTSAESVQANSHKSVTV